MLLRFSAVLLICSIDLLPQELPKYRVSLRVNASEELKGTLKTAFIRRFRSVKDAALVDKDPQFIVRVTGSQTAVRRGSRLRVVLAYTFTTVYEGDLAPLFDPKELPPEAARNVANLVKTLEQYQASGIVTASLSGIEQACGNVVAAFDSTVLDENRRAVREVKPPSRTIGK